jgi:GntR family transcriptional regulator
MLTESRVLNPSSPIPLYRQLADILAGGIGNGEFPIESRIPSEHELAERYGIGRPTVRQATEHLIRMGLLIRKRGSGTYVRPKAAEVDLFSLCGTLSAFQKEGIRIETRLTVPLVKTAAEDTGNPFSGKKVCYLERLTRAEGEPVLLEEMYLSCALFPGIEHLDLSGKSISRIIDETYYLAPSGGKQTFCIGYPGPLRSEVLGISPVAPILLVKRSLHFPEAENGIYAELYCRTDRFVFSQIIER